MTENDHVAGADAKIVSAGTAVAGSTVRLLTDQPGGRQLDPLALNGRAAQVLDRIPSAAVRSAASGLLIAQGAKAMSDGDTSKGIAQASLGTAALAGADPKTREVLVKAGGAIGSRLSPELTEAVARIGSDIRDAAKTKRGIVPFTICMGFVGGEQGILAAQGDFRSIVPSLAIGTADCAASAAGGYVAGTVTRDVLTNASNRYLDTNLRSSAAMTITHDLTSAVKAFSETPEAKAAQGWWRNKTFRVEQSDEVLPPDAAAAVQDAYSFGIME